MRRTCLAAAATLAVAAAAAAQPAPPPAPAAAERLVRTFRTGSEAEREAAAREVAKLGRAADAVVTELCLMAMRDRTKVAGLDALEVARPALFAPVRKAVTRESPWSWWGMVHLWDEADPLVAPAREAFEKRVIAPARAYLREDCASTDEVMRGVEVTWPWWPTDAEEDRAHLQFLAAHAARGGGETLRMLVEAASLGKDFKAKKLPGTGPTGRLEPTLGAARMIEAELGRAARALQMVADMSPGSRPILLPVFAGLARSGSESLAGAGEAGVLTCSSDLAVAATILKRYKYSPGFDYNKRLAEFEQQPARVAAVGALDPAARAALLFDPNDPGKARVCLEWVGSKDPALALDLRRLTDVVFGRGLGEELHRNRENYTNRFTQDPPGEYHLAAWEKNRAIHGWPAVPAPAVRSLASRHPEAAAPYLEAYRGFARARILHHERYLRSNERVLSKVISAYEESLAALPAKRADTSAIPAGVQRCAKAFNAGQAELARRIKPFESFTGDDISDPFKCCLPDALAKQVPPGGEAAVAQLLANRIDRRLAEVERYREGMPERFPASDALGLELRYAAELMRWCPGMQGHFAGPVLRPRVFAAASSFAAGDALGQVVKALGPGAAAPALAGLLDPKNADEWRAAGDGAAGGKKLARKIQAELSGKPAFRYD